MTKASNDLQITGCYSTPLVFVVCVIMKLVVDVFKIILPKGLKGTYQNILRRVKTCINVSNMGINIEKHENMQKHARTCRNRENIVKFF